MYTTTEAHKASVVVVVSLSVIPQRFDTAFARPALADLTCLCYKVRKNIFVVTAAVCRRNQHQHVWILTRFCQEHIFVIVMLNG